MTDDPNDDMQHLPPGAGADPPHADAPAQPAAQVDEPQDIAALVAALYELRAETRRTAERLDAMIDTLRQPGADVTTSPESPIALHRAALAEQSGQGGAIGARLAPNIPTNVAPPPSALDQHRAALEATRARQSSMPPPLAPGQMGGVVGAALGRPIAPPNADQLAQHRAAADAAQTSAHVDNRPAWVRAAHPLPPEAIAPGGTAAAPPLSPADELAALAAPVEGGEGEILPNQDGGPVGARLAKPTLPNTPGSGSVGARLT